MNASHRLSRSLAAIPSRRLLALRCIALRLVVLRFIVVLRFVALRLVVLRLVAIRLVALRHVALRLATSPLVALPFLALPLGLAGCSTPQDRAAQAQAEVEHMMVVYGPACTRLGYAAGSDPWRSCVLTLSAKDDLQRYGSAPHYYAGWGMGRWPGGWWGPYW